MLMLCYVMLCYVMHACYVMLCYVMLCYVMHACMHVYTYICVCACMYKFGYVCIYIYTHIAYQGLGDIKWLLHVLRIAVVYSYTYLYSQKSTKG